MFHLNDRQISDSSFVPKMAVVYKPASLWDPAGKGFAQVLVTSSRKRRIRGEDSANRNDKLS